MTTNPGPHLFWITSRAAGTAALLLASVSVGAGLLMSTGMLKRRGLGLRATHEALSLATLAAIALHGLVLVGDGFLHPSLADVTIPFVFGYKTLWTTLGIVAGWTLMALGLSYYARRYIGQRRWRSLHRLTAVAWLLGVVHSIGEGTDAGRPWFLIATALVAVPALVLLLGRIATVPPGAGIRDVRG